MEPSSKVVRLLKISLGNALEWYDFCLFGYFAVSIGNVFFHSQSPLSNLLLAFATFAIGFVARPVGGFIFGYLGDRTGRYFAMNLSIILMGLASISMAFLPGYASIGVAAPILLILVRIIQGLSAGGQFGNLLVITTEDKKLKNTGYYTGIAYSVSLVGFLLAAGVSYLILHFAPAHSDYAWRIPFVIGAIPLVLHLWLSREHAAEEEAQAPAGSANQANSYRQLWTEHKLAFSLVVMISAFLGTIFYMAFTYLVTFSVEYSQISMSDALLINTIALVVACFLIPAFGYLSDYFGRRNLFISGILIHLVLLYPAFTLLTSHSLFSIGAGVMLYALMVCWLAGVAMPLCSELFPREVRASGCCASYGIGMAICGFAPMIATKLTSIDPGYLNYLLLASLLIGLAAALAVPLVGRSLPHPLRTLRQPQGSALPMTAKV
ncbi:MFS transporter [Dongshaea marina]|uniref:MFS transporter n=1 Tax=Dongshaea marina TaxID=2047966 RepID=UPI000D3ED98B|nr:MFS transporter [Dongshaea marina]